MKNDNVIKEKYRDAFFDLYGYYSLIVNRGGGWYQIVTNKGANGPYRIGSIEKMADNLIARKSELEDKK